MRCERERLKPSGKNHFVVTDLTARAPFFFFLFFKHSTPADKLLSSSLLWGATPPATHHGTPVWIHSLTEHLILDKPRLESFETPAVSSCVAPGWRRWRAQFHDRICSTQAASALHLQTSTVSTFVHGHDLAVLFAGRLGSVQALESEVQDDDDFLQLVISSTCRPTLGSREFITNQPLTLFHEAPATVPPPRPKPTPLKLLASCNPTD